MRTIFHFDSPPEKYHCDAAVLFNSDPIKVAGGAKCVASPEHETERAFLLDQIRKSIRLHGTDRVILMLHSDCGAYGGLKAFGNDPGAEAECLAG